MKTADLILRQSTPFRDDQIATERAFRRWMRDLPLQALRGEHAAPNLTLPPLLDIPLSGGLAQLTGQSLRLILIAHAEIMKARRASEPLDVTLSSFLISWKTLSGETLHLLSGVLLAALSLGREDDETLPHEAALISQPSAFTGGCLGAALGLAATLRARGETLPTGLIQRLLAENQDIPGVAHNLAFAALWSSQLLGEHRPLPALLEQGGHDLRLPGLMSGLLSASERELPELHLGRLSDTGDIPHWNGAPMQGLMEEAAGYAPRLLARLLRRQGHLSGLGPANISAMFWQGDELSPSLWMTGDEGTLMHRVTSLLQMILSQCHSPREWHRVTTQLAALQGTEEAEITPLILAMRALSADASDLVKTVQITSPQARRAAPTLIGWLNQVSSLNDHDLRVFQAVQGGQWTQIRQAAAQTTPHAVAALALRELLRQPLKLSPVGNATPDEPWRQASNTHAWMWLIQDGPELLSRLKVPHNLPQAAQTDLLTFTRLMRDVRSD